MNNEEESNAVFQSDYENGMINNYRDCQKKIDLEIIEALSVQREEDKNSSNDNDDENYSSDQSYRIEEDESCNRTLQKKIRRQSLSSFEEKLSTERKYDCKKQKICLSKNIPKNFGSRFCKYLEKIIPSKSKRLPGVKKFISKKRQNYGLGDFREFFKNEKQRQIALSFFLNHLYSDLATSNRAFDFKASLSFIDKFVYAIENPESFTRLT